MKTDMKLETRRLADLHPADYNPRVPLTPADPEYQDIKASLQANDYSDPIVVNYDGTIIKGHQRRQVMMDLGTTEAPVIVLDIRDKNREKALNIALNKITGRWENKILKDLLIEIDASGIDLAATGFKHDELDILIAQDDIAAVARDDGFDPDKAEADSKGAPPRVRYGDLWQLGKHHLLCGDATEAADIRQLMGGQPARLILTDPPYNVDYGDKVANGGDYFQNNKRSSSDILNDKKGDAEFARFLRAAYGNMYEAAAPGCAAYIFHADSQGLPFRQQFIRAGFKLAEVLIWEKNTFVLGRQDYHWRHEPILYGWKEGAAHYFIKDRTQDTVFLEDDLDLEAMKKADLVAWIKERLQREKALTSVQYEAKPHRSDLHPTMKPVELVGRLMANSSRPGWAVLDPFLGSGTTLIAAEQLGRVCYGTELDPHNCDIIIKRWEDLTGQEAVRL